MFFIDTRTPPTQESLSKTILIANTFKMPVDLLIDSQNNHPDRWYWPELLSNSDKKLRQDEALDAVLKVEAALKTSKIKFQKINLTKSSYATQINNLLVSDTETLLILENKLRKKHHHIFQEIQDINTPILLMSNTPWQTPINLAVAISPFHDKTGENEVDQHLVELASKFKTVTAPNWPLIHSIYVPPMAVEFRKKIQEIHTDSVLDFAAEQNIRRNRVVIITGNPEDSLPQWVTHNQTNILIVGLLKRSKHPFRWVGSTASALIEKIPCDLILAR
jgi:hypothetical protein